MNFNMIPKKNSKNRFIEHCVNEGNNFEVEIIHWRIFDNPVQAANLNDVMGNERWNVYATIKPGHPLFNILKDVEKDDYNGAMNRFPFDFHGGITYVRNDGDKIKVGDDYMHLGDELIKRCAELPGEVKLEAEELINENNTLKKQKDYLVEKQINLQTQLKEIESSFENCKQFCPRESSDWKEYQKWYKEKHKDDIQ